MTTPSTSNITNRIQWHVNDTPITYIMKQVITSSVNIEHKSTNSWTTMLQCVFDQQRILSKNVEENRQLMTTELLLIYNRLDDDDSDVLADLLKLF
jgi:hypothetical protein